MIKYNGIIHGFFPSISELFSLHKHDKWLASDVSLEIEAKHITIAFFWEGYQYLIKGKMSKPDFYQCKFTSSDGASGDVYMWVYANENGLMISGDWIEENYSYEIVGKFNKAK